MTPTPIANASDLANEPTTTYTPTPSTYNLFSLLTVLGDFDPVTSVADQVARHGPVGAVRGTISDVRIGAIEGGPGRSGTAILTIKPTAKIGPLKEDPSGAIEIEVYRPRVVTAEWLAKADGYQNQEVIALVKPATPVSSGKYILAGIQGLYARDARGVVRTVLAAPGDDGPMELRGGSIDNTWRALTSALKTLG